MPLANARDTEGHLRDLEDWLRSYDAEELFDAEGALDAEIAALAPSGDLRMSANPVTNGGLLLKDLRLPDWRDFAVDVPTPGAPMSEATRVLGTYLTEVIRLNPDNFRIFGPDETASNRLQEVYAATDKQWNASYLPTDDDDHLARAGRVMEMLSEHQCEGWLEGYLLTGRHGLMSSYEAFIHVVDSMFNQHAKWLKVTNHIPWRRPIASLNYLLSSHVWRQDHNGFSPSGPRVHRPRGQQEGRDHPGLPAGGHQHAAGDLRPCPALQAAGQRRRGWQAASAELPERRRRRRSTRSAAWASGSGRAPRSPARNPTSSSAAPATCRPSRSSRPRTSCAGTSRTSGSAWSTSWT